MVPGAKATALALAACLMTAAPALAQGQTADTDVYGPGLAQAPVAAESQYVYLSTVQHLAEGATPELLGALKAISETALTSTAPSRDLENLESQLNDPIMLQADPASIVAMAATLIEAGQTNADALAETLTKMQEAEPLLGDEQLTLAILENGMRFRVALAQAIYSTDLRQLSQEHQQAIEAYRQTTYDLRGRMEIMQFDIALTDVTDEALDLQRSAFAALHRATIDEIDPYSFEEDGRRAKQLSDQARASIAREMRSMYLQLILIAAAITL